MSSSIKDGSESILQEFYGLILLTHRRHRVPPQPLAWFRNVIECCGSRVTIYVARVDNRPIGSIFTLRHKNSPVYKYGGSDKRFHNVGAMPRLFWQAIQQAKSEQLLELDLGRSDQNNEGLTRFKDHLGAPRTSLEYWRSPGASAHATEGLAFRMAQHFLTRLPDRLFRLAGELFYRHAG
jgi:lipid II:glycine glycyltransferase (peptidoglycan interpeptide bridge formation enzyme)